MRISLRATYGIIAAVDLALHDTDVPVQAKTIARRRGIPARFLEQVLHAMKKAGLVMSHRGAQGGYVLNRRPEQLSLADIIEALEGPVMGSASSNGRAAKQTPGAIPTPDALLAHVWERIKQAELDILSEITIEQLAGRQRQLEQQRSLMYHI
ncbi:MAG TPA: Rrf2 family transcriptional regulator [Nitrospiraceae bacterium]|nr:Rrf2 family transcriptional regulator [Nitrospiraceae bacterium]